MSPNAPIEVQQEQPLSRTYQYRKVMKPMLERKRRARINKCLDELKDLMVNTLAAEGENVTKLEKADVLELTVRHLRKLKQNHMLGVSPAVLHDRYMSGFAHCAAQVGSFMASTVPSSDVGIHARLMNHISKYMGAMDKMAAIHSGSSTPTVEKIPSIHTAFSQTTISQPSSVNTTSSTRLMTPPLTPPSHDRVPTHHPVLVQCSSPSSSPVSIPSFSSPVSIPSFSSPPLKSHDDKMWRPW